MTERLRIFVCILSFFVCPAWSVTQIEGLSDVDLGVWTPSAGGVSGNEDFCVAARRGNSANEGPYQVMVEPLAGTVFELLSVTDPGRRIPVAFTFQDLLDGFSEVLVPAVYSPREMNGVRDCVGANNARLQVSAAAGDVALAPPGNYQALFRFRGRGTANRSLSEDFAVSLSILQLIRISGLDPIDLGTYAGVDDLRGGDDFCVFSNSPTGIYNLIVSGQGAGGDFIAESAGSTIPLMVEVDDGSGFVGAAPNAPALKNNAASNSLDCGGASNASIRVTARALDMQDIQGGVYSGELTLIVAPI